MPARLLERLATVFKEKLNDAAAALRCHQQIMEIDPDMVPWQDDLVTVTPRIESGHLLLPTGPGWGTEVNEDAVRAHPPKGG